ncbi:MAG: hypothetical protein KGL66_15365, partial [Alphaproteobacteria bacterium]|nr:hypothetical protein [Alphaproteobacteria bacterium]
HRGRPTGTFAFSPDSQSEEGEGIYSTDPVRAIRISMPAFDLDASRMSARSLSCLTVPRR